MNDNDNSGSGGDSRRLLVDNGEEAQKSGVASMSQEKSRSSVFPMIGEGSQVGDTDCKDEAGEFLCKLKNSYNLVGVDGSGVQCPYTYENDKEEKKEESRGKEWAAAWQEEHDHHPCWVPGKVLMKDGTCAGHCFPGNMKRSEKATDELSGTTFKGTSFDGRCTECAETDPKWPTHTYDFSKKAPACTACEQHFGLSPNRVLNDTHNRYSGFCIDLREPWADVQSPDKCPSTCINAETGKLASVSDKHTVCSRNCQLISEVAGLREYHTKEEPGVLNLTAFNKRHERDENGKPIHGSVTNHSKEHSNQEVQNDPNNGMWFSMVYCGFSKIVECEMKSGNEEGVSKTECTNSKSVTCQAIRKSPRVSTGYEWGDLDKPVSEAEEAACITAPDACTFITEDR